MFIRNIKTHVILRNIKDINDVKSFMEHTVSNVIK